MRLPLSEAYDKGWQDAISAIQRHLTVKGGDDDSDDLTELLDQLYGQYGKPKEGEESGCGGCDNCDCDSKDKIPPKPGPKKCTCSTSELMTQGCKCGGK